jgi:hypothetical protein
VYVYAYRFAVYGFIPSERHASAARLSARPLEAIVRIPLFSPYTYSYTYPYTASSFVPSSADDIEIIRLARRRRHRGPVVYVYACRFAVYGFIPAERAPSAARAFSRGRWKLKFGRAIVLVRAFLPDLINVETHPRAKCRDSREAIRR